MCARLGVSRGTEKARTFTSVWTGAFGRISYRSLLSGGRVLALARRINTIRTSRRSPLRRTVFFFSQRFAEALKETGLLLGTKCVLVAEPVKVDTHGNTIVFSGPSKAPRAVGSDGTDDSTIGALALSEGGSDRALEPDPSESFDVLKY